MKYLFWDTERIKNTKIYMLAYILTDEFFNISKQKIIIDTSIDLSKRHAPRIKVNQLKQEATCVASFKELFNEILPFINDKNITKVCFGKDDYAAINDQLKLHNLQPVEGIFVKNSIDVPNWFLNGKDDVRSCYALEDVVTEFDIQGLEIDYSVLAWDADFRFVNGEWTYNNFTGNKWNKVNSEENRLYLKNAYRVLMTRARQGMAIFIPKGSDEDATRQRSFYDETYNYLKEIMV